MATLSIDAQGLQHDYNDAGRKVFNASMIILDLLSVSPRGLPISDPL